MKNKLLTHDQLKQLYLQKMLAMEKKNTAFLDKLQVEHPELFDKKFLYEMLQKELEETGSVLPMQIEILLINAIKEIDRVQ